ncbi:hypothetical protein EB354_13860 [Chryseobacterium balustinum]|uniref:Uncharacterized protein n=2 Tax=Chryseobacterium group TaxID=2782232 RepID=A0AAX2IMS3_9FLAO|nr:hypothetical protein EB354_13860 [Chryseobacterium balustinum]SKC03706.1 hypothetical protein SAMN05421800_12273 [Chryseobacterium balustinum]SQA90885.1 Uncharacterised protein [Chryseobacterium balustinum]
MIMPSTSEVGHARNVANLQKLSQQVSVYTLYNPPVPNLTVANLQGLYATASAKLVEVEDKRNANKNAIALRQTAFENLKPILTRIINRLEILGLMTGTLDQAKSLNRSIQGSRKKRSVSAKTDDEQLSTNNSISNSRQSFTQQAENFGILLQLLATIPNYNPDEDELKLTDLSTYKDSLINATQFVDQTEAELNIKLIERDQILYAEEIGLYSIAQNVKKYVKSLYGATSPEYATISPITFKKQK